MRGKSPIQEQKNMFKPLLKEFINMEHELVKLSEEINWKELESGFSGMYSNTGTPSKPLRLMTGLLILKQLYNLGDETVVEKWIQNPYYQYFCGEAHFNWKQPCAPSDLVHFRKRIGTEGIEQIFALSVGIHGRQVKVAEVSIDTTAQEKNITYPTDVKLHKKIISSCWDIAGKEGLALRQSYRQVVKKQLLQSRLANHPKRMKEGKRARRKLRTIAGRLVREVGRKTEGQYNRKLALYTKVLHQQRHDQHKIYSLHEPEVACIAKGKAHKKYEYGSKVSFAITKYSNIIVGVKNFKGNPHDSKTLEPVLEQITKITGKKVEKAIVDRGFAGPKKIHHTEIVRPSSSSGTLSQRRSARRRFRRRAAIEPVISHVKHDHRMLRNFLKGSVGDQINATMAAAAYNFKKRLKQIRQQILDPFYFLFYCQFNLSW